METTERLIGKMPSMIIIVGFLLLLGASVSFAQTNMGAISGTVTDPSGRVVPKARVTATNVDQGTIWSTQTNTVGIYNFPRLPAGHYAVKVEASGFAVTQRQAFRLQMNQVARVNIQLKLGVRTRTVTVKAAPPLLQTATSDVGLVTSSNFNVNLPLASRNFVELTTLTPGVTQTTAGAFNGAGTIGSARPEVNGNRQQTNNFLLDGIGANEIANNEIEYQPSTDAIHEFNMLTNNAPAQYGQFQGGIISVTLKSGTNQYHGDLYEYYRNAAMDANSWANDWKGLPKAGYNYNMFGATFGGPIKKNKLFFFADYEGLRNDTPPSTSFWTAMTPQEQNGDFSQLLTVSADNPKVHQLYNPCASFSGPCTAPANPGAVRQPFPGNIIPTSMIDPVAQNLFSSGLYPTPDNNNLRNNTFNTKHSYLNRDQGDIKIDYMLNDTNHISGSYSQSFQIKPSNNSIPLLAQGLNYNPFHLGVADWTHTFSPTMVMDARFGVNRTFWHTGGSVPNVGNLADKLGIAEGNIHGPGLPSLGIGGNGYASGVGTSGVWQLFATTSIDPSVALIMTHGHHMTHLGFEAMRHRINTYYSGNEGRFGHINFSGTYTSGPDPTNLSLAGSSNGVGEADFILGLPAAIGLGTNQGTWGQRSWVLGPYVQDDWRVTPHLTLNLGLRWQYNQPWVEVYNRQANFGLISGTLELPGQNGNSRALYNTYWNDWEPRVGFAYNPSFLGGKTVVRGAFGMSSFLEGTGTNLRLPLNPPWQPQFQANYNTGTLRYFPGSTTDQGFSLLNPLDPYIGANIKLWDPNILPAIVEQWNFGIEHQFPSQMLLSVAYVGQHGTHLMVPMPYFQSRMPGEAGCPSKNTKPCPSLYLSGNPTLYNEIGQISGTATNGNQAYDALQVSLSKQMTQGLEFRVSYTWAKAMTNAMGFFGFGGQVTPSKAYQQDLYNAAAEWGPAGFDNPQNFVASYVYQLPFGAGKRFGSQMNPVFNAVLGGWQLSGIVTLHSGFPSTVRGPDKSGVKSRGSRANCLGPVTYPRGVGQGTTWFSTGSFSIAPSGTYGTCGVGTVWGPGLADWDTGIMKNFRIGKSESRRLQFRGEFINFTNTPHFSVPNMNVNAAAFGEVLGAAGSRIIQVGAKLYF